jgi:hypothetical protein
VSAFEDGVGAAAADALGEMFPDLYAQPGHYALWGSPTCVCGAQWVVKFSGGYCTSFDTDADADEAAFIVTMRRYSHQPNDDLDVHLIERLSSPEFRAAWIAAAPPGTCPICHVRHGFHDEDVHACWPIERRHLKDKGWQHDV